MQFDEYCRALIQGHGKEKEFPPARRASVVRCQQAVDIKSTLTERKVTIKVTL
jgi:hypothetical protein